MPYLMQRNHEYTGIQQITTYLVLPRYQCVNLIAPIKQLADATQLVQIGKFVTKILVSEKQAFRNIAANHTHVIT